MGGHRSVTSFFPLLSSFLFHSLRGWYELFLHVLKGKSIHCGSFFFPSVLGETGHDLEVENNNLF